MEYKISVIKTDYSGLHNDNINLVREEYDKGIIFIFKALCQLVKCIKILRVFSSLAHIQYNCIKSPLDGTIGVKLLHLSILVYKFETIWVAQPDAYLNV